MPNISGVFQPWGSLAGDLTEHTFPFRVSNGVTVTTGFPLIMVNGYLELANGTTADEIVGVAAETVVGTATSAKALVYTDPNLVYAADSDAVHAFADIGDIFRVVASGSTIDTSSGAGSSQQAFVLVKVDPYEENDMSAGLFKIYTNLWQNNSQT